MVLLPGWDCSTCTQAMKRLRGCGVQGMTATLLGKERVTTCPLFFSKQHPTTFRRVSHLYAMLERGFLPDDGGVQDQSALTMSAITIYSNALARAREDQRKTKPGKPGKG